jgi:hypothetical protein
VFIAIDRFEGNFAVVELEDRTMLNLPRRLFPEDAAEGSIWELSPAPEEAEKRREHIRELKSKLFKDKKSKN